jgi:hypothetical protein
MGTRAPLIVSLGLLALVGIYLASHRGDAPAPGVSKENAPEAAGPKDTGDEQARTLGPDGAGPLSPLVNFLGSGNVCKEDKQRLPDLGVTEIRFLIATVPDPLETPLGALFDLTVEAMVRAAERQNYVLDSSFLPWSGPGPGSNPGANERAAARGATPRHMSEPGTLLFRKNQTDANDKNQTNANDGMANPKLLLIFLVGETPTAGIHKTAFTECLNLILRFQKCGKPRSKIDKIRIIGPYFSGSSSSLQMAITTWSEVEANKEPTRWEERQPTFRLLSGSAVAFNKDVFDKACKCSPAKVDFQATVLLDKKVMACLLDYLADPGHPRPGGRESIRKVAVLTESTTPRGSLVEELQEEMQKSNADIIVLPFPMHISQVRTAYARDRSLLPGGAADPVSPVSALPVPLAEQGGKRELPLLAPGLTTSAAELVLAGILTRISREDIRYLGIVATDVRDKLFLARLVHQYCPDVQLFTTSSDLLLTHPDYRASLRGMVIGSTYPLFSRNQHWSYPFEGYKRRLGFSGQSQEGYYNATLAHLDEPSDPADRRPLLEYGPPFANLENGRQRIRESRHPDAQSAAAPDWDTTRPPIWISVVGQEQVWPLAFQPRRAGEDLSYTYPAAESGYVLPPPDSAEQERVRVTPQFSGLWLSSLLGLTLVCAVLGYRSYAAARPVAGAGEGGRGRFLGPICACRDEALSGQHKFYLVACLAPLAVLYGYVTSLCFIPLTVAPPPWAWPGLAACVTWALPLLTLAFTLWLVFVLVRSVAPHHRPQCWQQLLPALAVAPVALFVLALTLPAAAETVFGSSISGQQLCLFERATALVNGVSPVVPAAFLACLLAAWGYSHLKRVYLLDRFAVPCPYSGAPAKTATAQEPEAKLSLTAVEEADDQVRQSLARPHRALLQPALLVILALLGFGLLRLYLRFIPTFEGWGFDSVMRLAFGLAAVLTTCAFLQLLLLWRQLDRLLRRLASLPMAAAYGRGRLAANVRSLFGGYLDPLKPRDSHLELPQHQLCLLRDRYPAVRKELAAAFATAGANVLGGLDQAMAPSPAGRELRRDLADASRACLHLLTCCWAGRPVNVAFATRPADASGADSPAPASGQEEGQYPNVSADARQWLEQAEDFVAMNTVIYLNQFFAHLRNLVGFLTAAVVLLFLVVVSYPFQPQHLLLIGVWTIVLAVAAGIVTLFVQMNRNELLSRIADTTPNRFTPDAAFVRNISTYALPLLGLAAAMFPDVWNLVSTWLEPLFRALK